MSIPIVDQRLSILDWTDASPRLAGSSLRHLKAERLLGGRLSCVYIGITDADAARRAGAPPGWRGEWRCLALCAAATAERLASAEASTRHDGRAVFAPLSKLPRPRRAAPKTVAGRRLSQFFRRPPPDPRAPSP